MKEVLLQILVLAYGGVGVVGLVGYWPTIKDLYQHKKASANIVSYVLWTITTGITWFYSLFVLPDVLFQFVSVVNFASCAAVLVLSIWLKNRGRVA